MSDAASDPLLGATLGSFRVARVLGAGGMGQVYQGVHPAIGSRVAIKVLSYACAESPAAVERFFTEARAVNLIRHEHIVNVLDMSVLPDGRPYIVMEYIQGKSLSDVIGSQGALPLGWLARYAVEVLGALAAAHALGIVHRDLKPDNLFVSPAGRAKVLDFGIAKLRGPEGVGPATQTGALLGTPHYMSPEQAQGIPAHARSDLYSLGVVLYEAATARKPFEADALFELLRLHIEGTPAPPSSLRRELPPAFEQCVLRALAKAPAHRFQSAAEMASALEAAARFLPVDSFAPPSLGLAPSAGFPGSRPPPLGATAGATVAPTPGASFGAVSATLTSPGQRRAAAPSRLPWVVAGLFGLAAFSAIAVLAVLFVTGRFDGDTKTTPPGIRIVTPKPKPAEPMPDPEGPFDPGAFLPEATRKARILASDAELTKIDVFGLGADGRVDFTRKLPEDTPLVDYNFRSRSRYLKWVNEPLDDKKTQCMVLVRVSKKGVRSDITDSDCDGERPLPPPRCKLKQIFDKTRSIKGGAVEVIPQLWYGYRVDTRDPQWFVKIGKWDQYFPDEC